MSDRVAMITALILERPLCLSCIADKSLVTVQRATDALNTIGSALVLTSRTDRCVACGDTAAVYSVGRPRLT